MDVLRLEQAYWITAMWHTSGPAFSHVRTSSDLKRNDISRRTNGAENFRSKRRRDPLIGVHAQHPVMFEIDVTQAPFPASGPIIESSRSYFSTDQLGERDSSVRARRIEDVDVVAPFDNRFKTLRQPLLLVSCQHEYGNFAHLAYPSLVAVGEFILVRPSQDRPPWRILSSFWRIEPQRSWPASRCDVGTIRQRVADFTGIEPWAA